AGVRPCTLGVDARKPRARVVDEPAHPVRVRHETTVVRFDLRAGAVLADLDAVDGTEAVDALSVEFGTAVVDEARPLRVGEGNEVRGLFLCRAQGREAGCRSAGHPV